MSHRILLLALLLLAPFASAQDAANPPDDARLDRLLEVTRAQAMVEGMLPQIEASQRQMVAQLTAGRELDDSQRARLDATLERSNAVLREALSWEVLGPLYRDVYRRTFSAEDVEAIIAFYDTPAGQRLVDRMPALVQHTMEAVQQRVLPLLQQFEQDLASELSGAQ